MHIKFNILLFLLVIPHNALDFLDFETFWLFSLIAGGFFLVFGLNDLFKYMEKRQQSQRQDWADTLSEIALKGKERTQIEKLEDLLSQGPPPLPEAFYDQLLHLRSQGFLLPRRYESNFYKIYNQRQKLMRLKETYENENHVFYQNELQNISSGTSERSRHLGAACPLDLRPFESFP